MEWKPKDDTEKAWYLAGAIIVWAAVLTSKSGWADLNRRPPEPHSGSEMVLGIA